MAGYLWQGWSFPGVPGLDFSGVVEEVGEGVTTVFPGDSVLGISWNSGVDDPEPFIGGAYGEYFLIAAYKLVRKPESMSFETAASIGCAGITAYQTLVDVGKVRAGTKLLILGASTAVGTVAMQLAKHLGAYVTVTSSSRALSYVHQFGSADKVVNYNEKRWEEDAELKDLDVILDCAGEPRALERAVEHSVLKRDGIFVSIANFSVGLDPAAHPPLRFAAFYGTHQDTAHLAAVTDLVQRGILRVPIEASFPFTTEGVQRMLEKVFSGKSLGKNILLIAPGH